MDPSLGRSGGKCWFRTVLMQPLTPNLGEVVVDGRRLETIFIAGRDSLAPNVVMLHEGLGSIATWRDFPLALAERTGCGVLVYSRYGHGASDKQVEKRSITFMHREAEVVLPELLDKLQFRRPIVLGHSDGGSIAIIFAGCYPDKLRGLVLEAPHVFVEELSVRSIAETKSRYQTTDLRARLDCYHAHADSTFWAWNDVWLDPRFRTWNIESYLATIRCPVLCFQGEQDEYGTRAQVDTIIAGVSNGELLMLANCGHAPHRDQRAATLAAIDEFVRRTPTIRPLHSDCLDRVVRTES
ncbi:MAG TPA: alpha/beta hydrolase [Terriglobales bacterium]|nr:alpha/beta hydrolase [Terriglobales bacterium]